jgi:hypothetical protein
MPRTGSVVHRTESPVHRTGSVVPRTESPVHRTESPVHRTESVVHRTESPVPRTAAPLPVSPLSRAADRDRRRTSASVVLRSVLEHGPVARSTIARLTGLSPASVTDYCARFTELGLIHEAVLGARTGLPVHVDGHARALVFHGFRTGGGGRLGGFGHALPGSTGHIHLSRINSETRNVDRASPRPGP